MVSVSGAAALVGTRAGACVRLSFTLSACCCSKRAFTASARRQCLIRTIFMHDRAVHAAANEFLASRAVDVRARKGSRRGGHCAYMRACCMHAFISGLECSSPLLIAHMNVCVHACSAVSRAFRHFCMNISRRFILHFAHMIIYTHRVSTGFSTGSPPNLSELHATPSSSVRRQNVD